MKSAKTGDQVTIHYIGTLDNGHIFDSTPDDTPLIFTIGAGEVFPALEQAIVGMTVGAAKNVVIPAAEAFGPRRQENIVKVARDLFPVDQELQVGRKLKLSFADGEERVMLVTALDDHEVTLDGNHALAGLDLTFALRLDAIE